MPAQDDDDKGRAVIRAAAELLASGIGTTAAREDVARELIARLLRELQRSVRDDDGEGKQ